MAELKLRLGKLPARHDDRTMKLMDIFKKKKLPDFPEYFTFPEKVDLHMWNNDRLGCCVVVASANSQTRFELIEQKSVIPITDAEIETQYFKESGGVDSGLIMLDHMKQRRTDGLCVGGQCYKCRAFAILKGSDIVKQMKATASLLGDVCMGFRMPDSFMDQFAAGHVWDDVKSQPNPWNGHAMALRNYDKDEVELCTWGKLQRATWDWVIRYADEAYCTLDERNFWMKDSPIDVDAMTKIMDQITA